MRFYELVEREFNVARGEMFVPPLRLRLRKGDFVSLSLGRTEAVVTLPPRLLDEGALEILRWYFRHLLAHAHYCPYDIKTAYMLQRAAYSVTGDWGKAYEALYVFSELQIDAYYLPRRFMEAPQHLRDVYSEKPRGVRALVYSALREAYGDLLPAHRISRDLEDYGRLALTIILSTRAWTGKVKLIASIIRKLEELGTIKRRSLKRGKPEPARTSIPLTSDYSPRGGKELREVFSSIEDEREAKAFYDLWVKSRVKEEAGGELKRLVERAERGMRGEKVGTRRSPIEGEEPSLPSTLSKPLKKLPQKLVNETWRRHWYRARAEKVLVEYETAIARKRATWSVYAYTDIWLAEDDIEELDLEATFEEGPLIPEVTTSKPVYRPGPLGYSLRLGPTPAVLVVLDSSKSMLTSFNDAAVAAFAALLGAKRAGGKTAAINFSTNYLLALWNEPDERKELVLSLPQGGYTILPLTAINVALKELKGEKAFVVIITDCGWQNISEALPFLSQVSSRGHAVVVFHIEGWKYPRNVDLVKRLGASLYRVKKPETLRSLVVRELERVRTAKAA